jgi:hypothetical protein
MIITVDSKAKNTPKPKLMIPNVEEKFGFNIGIAMINAMSCKVK